MRCSLTKIAVVGETFIDRYHIGKVRGLSAEAPIPIVDIVEVLEFEGGAGNVAANVKSLGAEVWPLNQINDDAIKNRLMVGDHQVARWDEADGGYRPFSDWYLERYLPEIALCEGLIISDYGKGLFSSKFIIQVAQNCGGVPVFIDTKQDPFLFSPFHSPFFFPNLAEYRAYRRSYEDLENVVLKRGAEGLQFDNQKWPAGARTVRSVNGAGDTVIAAFAVRYLELAWKADPQVQANFALEWAALAAAIACEQPYTTAVTWEAIEERKRGLIPV